MVHNFHSLVFCVICLFCLFLFLFLFFFFGGEEGVFYIFAFSCVFCHAMRLTLDCSFLSIPSVSSNFFIINNKVSTNPDDCLPPLPPLPYMCYRIVKYSNLPNILLVRAQNMTKQYFKFVLIFCSDIVYVLFSFLLLLDQKHHPTSEFRTSLSLQYNFIMGLLWPHGSWVCNYIFTQCLSPLTLWVRTPLRRRVLDNTSYYKF